MATQRQVQNLRVALLRQDGRPDSYLPVVAPGLPKPATAGATGQLGW